jgi:hypothetical protein
MYGLCHPRRGAVCVGALIASFAAAATVQATGVGLPPEVAAVRGKAALQIADEWNPDPSSAGAEFGFSADSDANAAVIGAPGAGGAAYVFRRGMPDWTREDRLAPIPVVANEGFGHAVAIDADTIAVGAPDAGAGRVVVFVRIGAAWTQQQVLLASDGANGNAFGSAVALDGDTLAVGASGAASGQGRVYVFTRSAGAWTEQTSLSANLGAAGDSLGASVALEGSLLVAGLPFADGTRGAMQTWTGADAAWTPGPRLTATMRALGDLFGQSVALLGGTLAVGMPGDDTDRGAAHLYGWDGAQWLEQATLISPTRAPGERLGWRVALAPDLALAGAPFALLDVSASGAAFAFSRQGQMWATEPVLRGGDTAAGDLFGWSIASTGDAALVGAPDHDPALGEAQAGAAYRITEFTTLFRDSFESP